MATAQRDGSRTLVRVAINAVNQHIREAGLRVGDTLLGEAFFAERLALSGSGRAGG